MLAAVPMPGVPVAAPRAFRAACRLAGKNCPIASLLEQPPVVLLAQFARRELVLLPYNAVKAGFVGLLLTLPSVR